MKRLAIAILVGIFLGAFAQYRVSGDPEVVRDTVRVEVQAESPDVSPRTANWVARAIYSETKQSKDFEYIGWVIRNRMESKAYPGTAREVILQPSQFSAFNSWERRKQLEKMAYPKTKTTEFRRAYRMAEYILTAPEEMNPLPGVTHFFMKDTMERKYGKSQPHWASSGELAWATDQTRYYRGIQGP